MQKVNYFDVPAISASGINRFLKSPMKYWKESPFNPDKSFDSDKDCLRLGRLAHILLLEPETLDEQVLVLPELNLRKKDDRETKLSLIEANRDKTWITQKEFKEISEMVNIAKKDVIISKLLKDGKAEHEVYWEREGVKCKAKLDFNREGLVIDYKTTRDTDIRKFEKSLIDYGYHRQAAWYMDAYEAFTGEKAVGFVFVVQDKECFEDIAAFSLTLEDIEIGRYENDKAFKEMNERIATGDWRSHPPLIQSISLPHWYVPTYA